MARTATSSLTGALSVAGDVPGLLDAARDVFTSGLNVVGAVGAAVFAVLAPVAVITLRGSAAEAPAPKEQRA